MKESIAEDFCSTCTLYSEISGECEQILGEEKTRQIYQCSVNELLIASLFALYCRMLL